MLIACVELASEATGHALLKIHDRESINSFIDNIFAPFHSAQKTQQLQCFWIINALTTGVTLKLSFRHHQPPHRAHQCSN